MLEQRLVQIVTNRILKGEPDYIHVIYKDGFMIHYEEGYHKDKKEQEFSNSITGSSADRDREERNGH